MNKIDDLQFPPSFSVKFSAQEFLPQYHSEALPARVIVLNFVKFICFKLNIKCMWKRYFLKKVASLNRFRCRLGIYTLLQSNYDLPVRMNALWRRCNILQTEAFAQKTEGPFILCIICCAMRCVIAIELNFIQLQSWQDFCLNVYSPWVAFKYFCHLVLEFADTLFSLTDFLVLFFLHSLKSSFKLQIKVKS